MSTPPSRQTPGWCRRRTGRPSRRSRRRRRIPASSACRSRSRRALRSPPRPRRSRPRREPRKLPWSSITRFEPTGRGAEPQVSTTVASATPRPALRQSSAALRMSSSRASKSMSVLRHSSLRRLSAAIALRHRTAFAAGRADSARTRSAIESRLWIGRNSSTCGSMVRTPWRLRLETLEAQQRIEPDQPPARAVQPVDLERQRVVGVALEPVGDQQHDRALREHAARPELVEVVQRGGDARAARPVEHAAPSRRPAPRPGRAGLSARVTLVSRVPNRNVCTRLRASVTAWRKCRNSRVYWLIEPEISSSATIGGCLAARPEIFQVDQRAARLHAGAQRAAHVDDVAAAVRRKPARLAPRRAAAPAA